MAEKIVLNKDQQRILDEFVLNQDKKLIYSLTGKAGTGKTTLNAEIINKIDSDFRDNSIVCISPTHQALSVMKKMVKNRIGYIPNNIKFATVHSFLGLKLQIDDDGNEIFTSGTFNKYEPRLDCDYLICDESSMVPDDLSQQIRKLLTTSKMSERRIRKQLIYVGDPYQLKPVSGEFNFVLNKEVTQIGGYRVIHQHLNNMVRQAAGSPIIELAHRITDIIDDNSLFNEEDFFEMLYKKDETGDKQVFDNPIMFMERYLESTIPEKDKIVGCYTNKLVNEYNTYIRYTLKFEDHAVNVEQPGQSVSYLPDYLAGDRVIFLQPYERNMESITSNGDVGKIVSTTIKESTVQGVELSYYHCKMELEDSENPYDIVSVNILDPKSVPVFEQKLKELANDAKKADSKRKGILWKKFFSFKNKYAKVRSIYANTNHKLQGSTFKEIYLNTQEYRQFIRRDLDNILRLIYVAITRGKKIKLLM